MGATAQRCPPRGGHRRAAGRGVADHHLIARPQRFAGDGADAAEDDGWRMGDQRLGVVVGGQGKVEHGAGADDTSW